MLHLRMVQTRSFVLVSTFNSPFVPILQLLASSSSIQHILLRSLYHTLSICQVHKKGGARRKHKNLTPPTPTITHLGCYHFSVHHLRENGNAFTNVIFPCLVVLYAFGRGITHEHSLIKRISK